MKSAENPSILLTIVDFLRGDHLSCYGYSRRTNPHLDDLATQSIVFDDSARVDEWRTSFVPAVPSVEKQDLDASVKQRVRALDYLDWRQKETRKSDLQESSHYPPNPSLLTRTTRPY